MSDGHFLEDASSGKARITAFFNDILARWVRIGGLLAVIGVIFVFAVRGGYWPEKLFITQDLPVLALCLALVFALRFVPAVPTLPRVAAEISPTRIAMTVATLCVVITVVCTYPVFEGYHMALDEYMGEFEAQIFTHGRLTAPIAAEWRHYADALQPRLVLIQDKTFWTCTYLPIDAALRAAAATVDAEVLVNPLWSGLSIVAVFGVGRQLWPARPWLAVAAAMLLATSSQFLIMAMSGYAMPAQLALNLVWLWLFLQRSRAGHLGALVTGFLACGLHQVVFHPLFVAPFVLELWLERRWGLAMVYTVSYGVFSLFWVLFWPVTISLMEQSPHMTEGVSGGWFITQMLLFLNQAQVGLAAPGKMAECLLRFITWLNPLSAPLALISAGGAMRAKGTLRALLLGLVFTIIAMLVIEPEQTHGWGYRYLHGLMGSVSLLATWSLGQFTDSLDTDGRARVNSAFIVACGAAVAVLLPLRAWQAHAYAHPSVVANALVRNAPAQVVLVAYDNVLFDETMVVRNDPYLLHSPKVMSLIRLDDAAVRAICSRYTVLVFDGREATALGMDADPWPPLEKERRLRQLMAQLRCDRRLG